MDSEQSDHENTDNQLQEAQNELKAANRNITDLQREIEVIASTMYNAE